MSFSEAGAGPSLGKQVIGRLEGTEGFVKKMADTILQGLDATLIQFNGEQMTERPDYKTRLAVWQQVMAYAEGLPMQRILAATMRKSGDGADLAKSLAESPAFQDYVERELAKSKGGKKSGEKVVVETSGSAVA